MKTTDPLGVGELHARLDAAAAAARSKLTSRRTSAL
jgi:hypothetical protein